jgi:hypothetical protein
MNKHLRKVHDITTEPGRGGKRKPPVAPSRLSQPLPNSPALPDAPSVPVQSQSSLSAAQPFPVAHQLSDMDRELMLDDDIARVIPSVRSRQTFWPVSHEEARATHALRKKYPRGRPGRPHAPQSTQQSKTSNGEESDDSFAEGHGQLAPDVREFIGIHPPNPDLGEVDGTPVLGRSKWQCKYLVAKAKLMLAYEENSERRRQLKDDMDAERADRLPRPIQIPGVRSTTPVISDRVFNPNERIECKFPIRQLLGVQGKS